MRLRIAVKPLRRITAASRDRPSLWVIHATASTALCNPSRPAGTAMVKLVVSDSAVLSVVGVGTAVHALHWSLDAKGAHDWHFDKSVPYDATTARSYAFALGGMAAQTVSVGLSENSKDAKKNALKASGLTWLVGAALLAYNAHEGKCGQAKDFTYGAAAGHAALGALCLWRGFDDADKWESKEFFKKEDDKDK